MSTADGPDIAKTRRELVNYLSDPHAPTSAKVETSPRRDTAEPVSKSAPEAPSGLHWSSLVQSGLTSWWHDHPARAGACLLKSATEEYARKKPMQVVTIAAVAGAATVLFKPWRMVSATALALSLLRTSNFTGMATSVLATAAKSVQKDRQ